MQQATKELIAIGMAVASVAAALVAIRWGVTLAGVLECLAVVWVLSGLWVSRMPRFWKKSIPEIYQIMLHERLREAPVSSILTWGGLALMVLHFVAVFRSF